MRTEPPTDKDRKFIAWAKLGAALFSTCSKAQYMTIITAANGRVIGTGYNGAPPGYKECVDGFCPRAIEGTKSDSSYENCIAVHSEINALMWTDRALREGGSLYVNGTPCHECARNIAGSGISRLVYLPDKRYRGIEVLEQSSVVLVPVSG